MQMHDVECRLKPFKYRLECKKAEKMQRGVNIFPSHCEYVCHTWMGESQIHQ